MESLAIDWKILVGQIINFAILFFLLKKVAFAPFMKLLKERREKIEDGIKKAEKAEETIQKMNVFQEELKEKNRAKTKEIIQKAEEEAQKRGNKLLGDTDQKRTEILVKAQKEAEEIIVKEKEKSRKEIFDKVFAVTEKVLEEKIDKEKDKKIIEKYLSQI